MMDSNGFVLEVANALENARVPYMLVGSHSSNMYSVPRSTKDADFVVELTATSINDVVNQLGAGITLDPQMSFETVTGTMRYRLRHADLPFTVEIFLLSDDPYDRSRFSRRIQRPFENSSVYVASAEDVVLNKLRWRRRKDLEDVVNVLTAQLVPLDWDYIHHWCGVHGTQELLKTVMAAVPKQ